MKQCVEAVSEQFMLKMNRRSVRVLKGVHSDVQVRRHFTDGPGMAASHSNTPLCSVARAGRKRCASACQSPGRGVIARTEHFVKHVVHGLHQVVARFGGLRSNPRDPQTGERDVHLRWPVETLMVFLGKRNKGVRSGRLTVVEI